MRAYLAGVLLSLSGACGRVPRTAAPVAPRPPAFERFSDARGLFSAEVDSAWTRLVDDDPSAPGVLFLAPVPERGEGPVMRKSISARFYFPGNGEFEDAEGYIRTQLIEQPGHAASPVADVMAGPWRARAFTLDEPYPSSPEAAFVGSERTEIVVLPLAKGFAVLSYSAPLEESARFESVFQRFIASLKIPA